MLMMSTAGMFVGCREENIPRAKDGRPIVVVQTFTFTEDFQRAVEDMCPDVCIKWYVSGNTNSIIYKEMGSNLPDILARSTYFPNENASEYVRDVSDRSILSDYSRNIIDNFRTGDGAIYWIPALATGECIVCNNDLFEKYNIAMPHDYESLKAADKAFKQHGVDGIAWALGPGWPYAPLLAMQVLAADVFNSYDGIVWKQAFYKTQLEEGKYILDDKVWPEMFRRFRAAIDCGLIDTLDLKQGGVEASSAFLDNKAAMLFAGTNVVQGVDKKVTMIPTYDTKGTPWIAVYMNLSLGVSKYVSDERLPYVMKVFDALISDEAQEAYNESRGGCVPLNIDPSILADNMRKMEAAITSGHSFLMFKEANGGFETAAAATARSMIEEGLTPEEAFRRCEEVMNGKEGESLFVPLNKDDPSQVLFTQEETYRLTTDDDHNSAAASCMTNTVFADINSHYDNKYDIYLAAQGIAGMDIMKGNYYLDKDGGLGPGSNLFFLCNTKRAIYPATMTVADLIHYINTAFYYYHRIDDGLPIMAGASYVVEKYEKGLDEDRLPFHPNYVNAGRIANVDRYPLRYVCKAIKKDGEILPMHKEINVVMARENLFYMTEYTEKEESYWVGFEKELPDPLDPAKRGTPLTFLVDWAKQGNKLCKPTHYLEMINK